MGNRHPQRASSAAPASKPPPLAMSRNGSKRGSSSDQPALAQAAAAAAAAVTATAAAGTSEISSSSSSASQLQLQQQHPADATDNTCQPIQLTAYQKNLLREAWQKINKKGAGSIGTLIFRRMFSKNPQIKQVFQHVTVIEGVFGFGLTPMQAFHHHSVLFVQVLDMAIEQLDDLRPFVRQCVEYGAKHAPYRAYGFKADMWDVFGECMTESAREWEGWKKHRETLRAWTILVSFIVDRMRQGYESAVRRQCFMQQLSIKQTPHSFEDATDQNDDEATSGSALTVFDQKRASRLRLTEESSPSRKSSKNNLAQLDASTSAAVTENNYEAAFRRAARMNRAESQ